MEPSAKGAQGRGGGPAVRLGRMVGDGVAPSIFGLIERGVLRDPELAAQLRGRIVFRFAEEFSPARVRFGPRVVLVEDGDVRRPDLAISGRLPDIVHLATVPTLGGRLSGVPNPADARGRAALARLASGRVRVEGNSGLARRVLRLLAV